MTRLNLQPNRVLIDFDRELYAKTVSEMYEMIPMTGHKIGDSMVQQGFVYEMAKELSKRTSRILSAGSYQDIAAEYLRFQGYGVYDVDPVLNYDLHTFVSKNPGLFDTIISTSVLEHTTDDEQFIADICALLKSGGYAIMTVDFKDDWQVGQPVPYTSNRFYTAFDLNTRLWSVLNNNSAQLIGTTDYNDKDRFIWDGIQYSFATYVFKKD
jgi:SAM-dependent methyltransferase